jgi:pimeloyl-ACP methyl ester carboxylesterase
VAGRAIGQEIEGEEEAAEMQAFLARHAHQPWYPSARKTWDEWTERVLAAEDAHEVDVMMSEVLPLYTADPDRPAVKEAMEEWRREARCDLAAVKAWESGLWQTIDVRPLMSEIRCPTLVLVGALDLICGPTQGRLIAAAVPGAELKIVPDSGHFIPVEAADSFRASVIEFAAERQMS